MGGAWSSFSEEVKRDKEGGIRVGKTGLIESVHWQKKNTCVCKKRGG